MKKHLAIVAAAALTVGTYSFAQDAAPPAPADQPKEGNALQRAGNRIGETAERAKDSITGDRTQSPNAEEIHDVLAQVAEAAFTKEGLDDMVERFVDADRNRLGQNQDALKNTTEIDGRVAQLQQDWKDKYGQEFDIKDEDKVYGTFASITEGEQTGDQARTATGVKVEGDVNADRNRADVKVENNTGIDAPRANTDGQTAADRNRNDPGRNVATVRIPESHGLPALDVPMIHEANGWKLDIPDSVDANKLAANVKSALTMCGESKDKWPATADEAYRGATHKVLAAIFDKLPAADAAAQPGAAPATPAAPQ